MQKIYLDSTMFFLENGNAHSNVDAFGYCVSFRETYCKSIKIEKTVTIPNPNIPANSGIHHSKNIGNRIQTAAMSSTYFFTIRNSFFTNCSNI